MLFQLSYTVPRAPVSIQHRDKVLLSGSCFTEHIGNRMQETKMQVLNNSNGILFNPMSIAAGLIAAINGKVYTPADLFYANETWNSWDFHSRFSHTDPGEALMTMNTAMADTTAFLKQAQWLIITFGSAYQYFTTGSAGIENYGVANCHKAPANWFEKRLLTVTEMQAKWSQLIGLLQQYNPSLRLIFTVSPVRHTRDGLAENNRSKARLLELAHSLTEDHEQCRYFPAYELVVDVLRDYRFFEQDMVHPNSLATQYVWEQFVDAYMHVEDKQLMQKIKEITTAVQHRPRFPQTEAAALFRQNMLHKTKNLQEQYPYLDLGPELQFFGAEASLL